MVRVRYVTENGIITPLNRFGMTVLFGQRRLHVRSCIQSLLHFTLVFCSLFSSALSADVPPIAQGVTSCLAAMSRPGSNVSRLPSTFRLVTWNIEKGNNPRWMEDLEVYQHRPQLLLLQEAYIPSPFASLVWPVLHESFSEGYRAPKRQTGVMTISSVRPHLHCALTAFEPWLTTPKATTVTRYGLAKSTEDLLVVNAHMVNFEWGVTGFREQWGEIDQIIRNHQGPLIVAGDFNTWNPARMAVLSEVKAKHNLQSVSFMPDSRTTAFGLPLDHVLFRKLQTTKAAVMVSNKSDHNSLWVHLTSN